MRLFVPALATLALMTTPAAAQSGVGFEIDGQAYELTLPEGFCVPSGQQREISSYIASLDTANDTKADLQRCGTFGTDYVHIKVQKQRVPINIPRAQFIDLISAHMRTQMGQEAMSGAAADVEQHVGKETEGGIKMRETGTAFGGKDEECAYIIGSSMVEVDGQAERVLFGTCLTVIGGYSIAINSYGLESGGATIEELSQRSRRIAGLIEVQ